jgi:hypothetical protein
VGDPEDGAVNVTDADALPAVAVPMVGAVGWNNGLRLADINPPK